jgi:hypothetical protein
MEQTETTVFNQTSLPLGLTPKDEKNMLNLRRNDVRNNVSLTVDDLFFVNHGSIESAVNSLSILRNGGGYTELKQAGFSDMVAMRDCAIYYAQVDAQRYQSELALVEVTTKPDKLQSFCDYLKAKGLPVPSLGELSKTIRANATLFNALRVWNSGTVTG